MNRELTIKVGQRSARRLNNAQTPENCTFDEGWDNPQECQSDMTCCCTPCDMPIDYCGCDNNNCCQNNGCMPNPCDCEQDCNYQPECNDPRTPCNPCKEECCPEPEYPCEYEPNYECSRNCGCGDEYDPRGNGWNGGCIMPEPCHCEQDCGCQPEYRDPRCPWDNPTRYDENYDSGRYGSGNNQGNWSDRRFPVDTDSDGSDGWVDGNEVDLCYDAPDCDNDGSDWDCGCNDDCGCDSNCKCFEKTTECIERRGPIDCDDGAIVTKTITRVRIVKQY